MGNMKISDFIKLAKGAQSTLKALDHPAEHIYLVGYSDPRVIPSLLFVSSKYNRLDIYGRAQLATAIQKGPFKYNFHILGANQLGKPDSKISRDMLYNAVKLYGRQPLMMDGIEFATKQDMNFAGHDRNAIVI
jgi:hypothetical protein